MIGSDDPSTSPISGRRSFVLNGAQQFNTYVLISGLKGVGAFSIKLAPYGDVVTLLVSDGTRVFRRPTSPFDSEVIVTVRFNNPLAQQILISTVQSTQRNARIRIDNIRF